MAAILRRIFSSKQSDYVELPNTDTVSIPTTTFVYTKPRNSFHTNIVKMNTTTKNIKLEHTQYAKINNRYYKIIIDDDLQDYVVVFDGTVDRMDAPTATVIPARKVLVNVVGMTFDSERLLRVHVGGLPVNNPGKNICIRSKTDVDVGKNDIVIIDQSTIICSPNVKHKYGDTTYSAITGTELISKIMRGQLTNIQLQHDISTIHALYDYSDKNKLFIAYHDFDDLTDVEVAAKLTSLFNEDIDELYIYGIDFIIQYVNKDNFNLFLFNHLRKLRVRSSIEIVLQHRNSDNMSYFW